MLTKKSKPDFGFLPLRPRTLISLWDMIEFFADEPENAIWKLNNAAIWAAEQTGEKGAQSIATSQEIKKLLQCLEQVEKFCDKLKLAHAKNRIDLFKTFLENEIECFHTVFCRELDGIKYAIQTELQNRVALLLSKDDADLFDKEKLFGDAVYDAFPQSELRDEIKDAGNCLATGLNTAAVFHLMRIAEFGLRKLAKHFKIKLPHQIEFATWGTVLEKIQIELDKKGVRRSPSKEKKLQRYGQLLLEIKAFQHLWRNPVSHLRGRYDSLQAESAFNHVRAFMQKLVD
jgi:hypothetical protein